MSEYYTAVRNPKWYNADNTWIVCEVDFTFLDDGFVNFIANPDDVEPYSKTIFDECVRGDYGPVAPYEPPPPLEQPDTTGTQTL